MFIKIIKTRTFFLLTATLFLSQCTTAVNPPEIAAAKPVVMKKKMTNPYPESTASYLLHAKNQEGMEKQKSLIQAAGRMITEGQLRQSAVILAQTASLTPQLADEKSLLLAQIDLAYGKPQPALNKLAGINPKEDWPAYQQIQFHELLAQAYRITEKPLESVLERCKLEHLLTGEKAQITNRRMLWLTLMHIPQEELNTLAAETSKSDLQGWVQLAQLARHYRDNPKVLLAALDEWQVRYSSHPANQILPNPLDSIITKLHEQPKQIALLLPLSGALQGPGMAVRDGFMAAHKNQKQTLQIKTYDTNTGEVTRLYQQALDEGADYIVGPLTKAQVSAVAALPHPVTTLFLNDIETNAQENSYSFSLSPVNEAMEVAIKAKSKGYSRALIIAPENTWGKEVSQAFTKKWQKQGGLVAGTMLYGAGDDLNKKMKDFLQVTQSQSREKRLKELLGQNIQSVLSRRHDFDMVFLLAYPSKARQIMPLLNYYYAGDVPVFATASVYSGSANPLKDKDLDGIIFCDIPWVFAHQAGTRNWPEQFNSYNRLYALGVDSYTLATQLNQLTLFPADKLNNNEGILYLKPSQQVARVLEWGQFRQGLVHSLGETA